MMVYGVRYELKEQSVNFLIRCLNQTFFKHGNLQCFREVRINTKYELRVHFCSVCLFVWFILYVVKVFGGTGNRKCHVNSWAFKFFI